VPSPVHDDESMNYFRYSAITTLLCLIKAQINPIGGTIWSVYILLYLKAVKMLSHQVKKCCTWRPDLMGKKEEVRCPWHSCRKGHAPFRVSWKS